MKKIVLMLLAASTFIFTGCTKTGPPGPQGVQGPQGPQGNANVIGSDAFDVTAWSKTGNTYYADFVSADITTAIANNGTVSVFILYDGTEWRPLPDIYGNAYTVYSFYAGGFSIFVKGLDGGDPGHPGTLTFRMVAISSALRQANPNTNWMDYKQTMKAVENFKQHQAVGVQ